MKSRTVPVRGALPAHRPLPDPPAVDGPTTGPRGTSRDHAEELLVAALLIVAGKYWPRRGVSDWCPPLVLATDRSHGWLTADLTGTLELAEHRRASPPRSPQVTVAEPPGIGSERLPAPNTGLRPGRASQFKYRK